MRTSTTVTSRHHSSQQQQQQQHFSNKTSLRLKTARCCLAETRDCPRQQTNIRLVCLCLRVFSLAYLFYCIALYIFYWISMGLCVRNKLGLFGWLIDLLINWQQINVFFLHRAKTSAHCRHDTLNFNWMSTFTLAGVITIYNRLNQAVFKWDMPHFPQAFDLWPLEVKITHRLLVTLEGRSHNFWFFFYVFFSSRVRSPCGTDGRNP